MSSSGTSARRCTAAPATTGRTSAASCCARSCTRTEGERQTRMHCGVMVGRRPESGDEVDQPSLDVDLALDLLAPEELDVAIRARRREDGRVARVRRHLDLTAHL